MYLAQRSKATCADAPSLRIDDRLEEKKNSIKIILQKKEKWKKEKVIGRKQWRISRVNIESMKGKRKWEKNYNI